MVILASSGTGRVFISGVTQAVSANLNGLGSAVIDSASDDVKITGSAGLGVGPAVFYNRGTCSVQSQFGSFFSSPCQQTSVSIPSVTPEWTCGLNLSGTFNCSVSLGKIVGSSGSSTYVSNGPGRVQSINVGNGGSSAYSSSGGRGGFASGFSSSSGPGVSFGQTVTNVNGQQSVQTSTGFGDGSVNCTASTQARSMT
ncbi:hypothetical protein CVIRNUC_000778 [Coccomyxa viridis]|uniref:Uncharacterized protein n=1 Tax=Coccomyxa viridis TaxID=1274662 RepID=A0AAV1HSV1_9CHLO|nr:hypothetical protein CVIRNUC_000778 [Coccomyxa viridis]